MSLVWCFSQILLKTTIWTWDSEIQFFLCRYDIINSPRSIAKLQPHVAHKKAFQIIILDARLKTKAKHWGLLITPNPSSRRQSMSSGLKRSRNLGEFPRREHTGCTGSVAAAGHVAWALCRGFNECSRTGSDPPPGGLQGSIKEKRGSRGWLSRH